MHVQHLTFNHGWARFLRVFAILTILAAPLSAFVAKTGATGLDSLAFSRPELRVGVTITNAGALQTQVQNMKALKQFIATYGPAWRFLMDERTGRVNLLDGGAIPFIPGAANALNGADFNAPCGNASCVPLATVEALARDFLKQHADVFLVDPGELELDPQGSGPVGDSLYFLRFQWKPSGLPVEGGSVFFRINNGNLIQVALDKIGPISLDPNPALEVGTAWTVLKGYLGTLASDSDQVVDPGTLSIVPVTPDGMDPDAFAAANFGKMIGYRLAYRIAFRRPGVTGTWEALVDAHTGDLLKFADANRYGHVHGGIRASDGLPAEEDHSFPAVDLGGGKYADSAGNFTGSSATTTLSGKYAHIDDACGMISASTTTGDINFGSGPSDINKTDCTAPAGNKYGAGNSKPSRTLYWNVSNINVRAQVWNPTNTWLPNNFVTLHVNGTPSCNASSGGADIYFYKRVAGSCNNLGEIPSVAMHEWGHSYDASDGSGSMDPPVECYADWTATMSTHLSCTGAGFLVSGNCWGYGDSCTSCTGVRDADWRKHASHTPWTASNNGSVYSCSSGGYDGPCGWEDHCESGISTQALWDLAAYDLEAAPTGLDTNSAWMLMDRLWFTGVKTLTAFYTCSSGTTSGCAGTTLYNVLRAMDDDGDGTANGTPHGAAIYAALARHNIACGAVTDAANQNQVSASCPSLTVPAFTLSPGYNQVVLSWTPITSATRYWIYRNEGSCSEGFTRIAVVNAPATTYTDTEVANGVTYNYRMMAAAASDACTGGVSVCNSVTPPGLAFVSNTVSDACPGGGAGNANGVIDAGETITLDPSLKNMGTSALAGLSGTLSTTTSGITITTATAAYPSIAGGATAPSNAPHFVFTVGTGVACGTTLTFNLHVTAPSGGPWDIPITLAAGTSNAGGLQTVLSQDFKSAKPPALPTGWTTQTVSGAAWQADRLGCANNSLRYPGTTKAADSWVFTPGVNLKAGVMYTLSFNQKDSSTAVTNKLAATVGTAPNASTQTTTVWSNSSLKNGGCTSRSGTFTPASTGTYYFGFHATSAANAKYMYVDDVLVTAVIPPSCAMNSCTP